MARGLIAILSAIVVGMMMVPGSVSADDPLVEATDREGDMPWCIDMETGEPIYSPCAGDRALLGVGCLDMKSYWLTQNALTGQYTFGMELYGALPTEGDAMPYGIKAAEWAMWIDPEPWTYVNEVVPLYAISLTYDGSSYDVSLIVVESKEVVRSVVFEISSDRSELQMSFPAESIGYLDFSWWCPSTRGYWGLPDTYGYRFMDFPDWYVCEGQVGYDLPW